ncbi:hypothetical protein AB0383_27080 [Amycolatopsis sp. NPDC051373]
MAKYVIGPEVALRLAVEQAVVGHRLLTPTLIRSPRGPRSTRRRAGAS